MDDCFQPPRISYLGTSPEGQQVELCPFMTCSSVPQVVRNTAARCLPVQRTLGEWSRFFKPSFLRLVLSYCKSHQRLYTYMYVCIYITRPSLARNTKGYDLTLDGTSMCSVETHRAARMLWVEWNVFIVNGSVEVGNIGRQDDTFLTFGSQALGRWLDVVLHQALPKRSTTGRWCRAWRCQS